MVDELDPATIDLPQEAQELLSCAFYYLSRSDWETARDLAMEARDLFDELHLAGESAEARLLIGFIDYEQGDAKTALPMLASAQQQFSMIGEKHKQCATLYLLAHCHLKLEKPGKALYALKMAHDIAHSTEIVETDLGKFIPRLADLRLFIDNLMNELASHHKPDI